MPLCKTFHKQESRYQIGWIFGKKGFKRQLTPTPHPSERSLSLERIYRSTDQNQVSTRRIVFSHFVLLYFSLLLFAGRWKQAHYKSLLYHTLSFLSGTLGPSLDYHHLHPNIIKIAANHSRTGCPIATGWFVHIDVETYRFKDRSPCKPKLIVLSVARFFCHLGFKNILFWFLECTFSKICAITNPKSITGSWWWTTKQKYNMVQIQYGLIQYGLREWLYRMVQMKYSENQPNLELKPEDDTKVTFQSPVSFQFHRP